MMQIVLLQAAIKFVVRDGLADKGVRASFKAAPPVNFGAVPRALHDFGGPYLPRIEHLSNRARAL